MSIPKNVGARADGAGASNTPPVWVSGPFPW